MKTQKNLRTRARFIKIALLATVLTLPVIEQANGAETSRISVHTNNAQASGADGQEVSISADGRYSVFSSEAADLVDGDTNGRSDVFLHDRNSGSTTRVSVSSSNQQSNGTSRFPSISDNGRFIAYNSSAENLVAGDTNGMFDIFVFNRQTGVTSRISIDSLGNEAVGGDSFRPSVSANGRYIAFHSRATNLVAGDTNNERDIFVHDRNLGETTRVNVSSADLQAIAGDSRFTTISDDGRFVAFQSEAANLVNDDTNGIYDIFVRDLLLGETTRVSVTSLGAQSPSGSSRFPGISGDGRYVVFQSASSSLVANDTNSSVDIFIHDRVSEETSRVNVDPDGAQALGGHSGLANISADGRFVVYSSAASNLVAGDTNGETDVFIHEFSTTETIRANTGTLDSQSSGGNSMMPDISADGRYVVYESAANNLVANDTNAQMDVFLLDRGAECNVSAAANKFSLPDSDWVSLTLPCEPPAGTTIADLFADDIDGEYFSGGSTTSVWRVFTYDSTTPAPQYVDPGVDGIVVAGQGFFIIQTTGSTATLDLPVGSRGAASNFSAAEACASGSGCQNLALTGLPVTSQLLWSLRGNPFNAEVEFDDLRVTTESGACADNDGCTLEEAYLPAVNVLGNVLFYYNGSSYISYGSGSTIPPWTGFWIAELAGSTVNTPVLRVPEN